MNIWELDIGDTAVARDGTEYLIEKDKRERIGQFGVVPVRYTSVVGTGERQKFVRGIEVSRK